MNLNDENISMEDAMKEIDNSMKGLRVGEVIKGTVLSISEKEIIVNIGYMTDGVIPVEDICVDGCSPMDFLKVDEEIHVYVVKRDNGEGNVLLSKKKADDIKLWDELYTNFKNEDKVIFKVTEVVKGGLRGLVMGLKAFMPASLVSAKYVNDLNEYVNKEIECNINEINKKEQKIVVSRKNIEIKDINKKKDEFWNNIKKGEIRRGTVSKLMNFGAFVDLGGQDGLIHLSELSWRKVKNPAEVVSEGQVLDVYVLDIDREKRKIALSLKELGENPWDNIEGKFIQGQVVEGKVAKILDFGAFVEISEGIEGLVHLSEISEENITNVSSVLSVGEKVKVKILDINKESHKISLSIKEAKEKVVEDFSSYVDGEESSTSLGDLFKDKLKGLKLE